MGETDKGAPRFNLEPGAFNACLFIAFKGDCDCQVCRVLRGAVESSIAPYLEKTAKGVKARG